MCPQISKILLLRKLKFGINVLQDNMISSKITKAIICKSFSKNEQEIYPQMVNLKS